MNTYRVAVLLLFTNMLGFGAFRPSFNLNNVAWNATEILVLAPTKDPGAFQVIETIKGEPLPGEIIRLPALAPVRGVAGRLSELSAGFFNTFEDPPPVTEDDKLVVFLRRDGAMPEYNPRPDLPVDTKGWQPADTFGDLRTSAVWVQEGRAYGFAQTKNPGPSHLVALRESEGEFRGAIQTVLQERGAMDHAMAAVDPTWRAQQLAALVRSKNMTALISALEKLAQGGKPAADELFQLLSDESVQGPTDMIIGSMEATGYGDVHFADLLRQETIYWAAACTTLKPGWWNDVEHYDEIQRPRNHYSRSYDLLTAIRMFRANKPMPDVKAFAAVWGRCPAVSDGTQEDKVTGELKLLLGVR